MPRLAGMDLNTDLLDRVVGELTERTGDLRKIATACGMPYDTVLRIKNRENDPGYSKVRALALHLFGPDNESAETKTAA